MYRIAGSLEGVAPFLFNRMVDPSSLDNRTRQRPTADQKLAEAELKVYQDDDGLYWPAWNLKRAIVDGCKAAGLKHGRGSMAPRLMATVFVAREPRFAKAETTIHEVVGKIPPRTGAAAIIRRPMLKPGWVLDFAMQIVDPRQDAEAIRLSLEEAGLLIGMGSWRPEYGRFVVREWNVTK